jgi:hypothetical protein
VLEELNNLWVWETGGKIYPICNIEARSSVVEQTHFVSYPILVVSFLRIQLLFVPSLCWDCVEGREVVEFHVTAVHAGQDSEAINKVGILLSPQDGIQGDGVAAVLDSLGSCDTCAGNLLRLLVI